MYVSKKVNNSKERMIVATVQNFMPGGDTNQIYSIKLKDIIDATTGDYLLKEAYIETNDEIRAMDLNQYDKIFFIGKPVRRRHRKIYFDKVHNAMTQKDSDTCKEHLGKLSYRKQYILNKKKADEERKEELQFLIKEIEEEKLKFKNNSLLTIRPIRTIETKFSNKFKNFPFLYTIIDTFKNHHNSFSERINHFKKIYKDIKEYNLYKEKINEINKSIIERYKEERQINKRSQNIENLLNTIDRCNRQLKNYSIISDKIVWQPNDVDDPNLNFSDDKVKTKSL